MIVSNFSHLSSNNKDLYIHKKIHSLPESIFYTKSIRRNFKDNSIQTEDGQYDNALIFAFNFNGVLNINNEVIDYLILKSSHQSNQKLYWLPILWAWKNNNKKNFSLSQEQLDYMFVRSDLVACNNNILTTNTSSPTPLVIAIIAQLNGQINLHILQWKYLIKLSDINHTKKILVGWANNKPLQSILFLDAIIEKCLLINL